MPVWFAVLRRPMMRRTFVNTMEDSAFAEGLVPDRVPNSPRKPNLPRKIFIYRTDDRIMILVGRRGPVRQHGGEGEPGRGHRPDQVRRIRLNDPRTDDDTWRPCPVQAGPGVRDRPLGDAAPVTMVDGALGLARARAACDLGRGGLAAGDSPAADHVDASLDLVSGGLRELGAAAGAAEFGVDNAVRLTGAVAPGADQAVEFLAQRGEGLTAHRRGGLSSRCRRGG